MPWGFFTSTGKEKLTEQEQNPAGLIVQFGSETVPTGWLACDGTEKAIASFPDLYTAIGTNYGALTDGSGGIGTTHFRLPDLRGRIPVGMHQGKGNPSNSRSGTGEVIGETFTARPVGTTAGAETITLTSAQSGLPAHSGHSIGTSGNHTHTVTSNGGHNHGFGFNNISYRSEQPGSLLSGASTFGPYYANTSSSGTNCTIPDNKSGVTATNLTAGQSATNGHNNVQPSLVVNFIIKT